MRRRLSQRDTAFLYILIVGWSLFVFLLGVSAGRTPGPIPAAVLGSPILTSLPADKESGADAPEETEPQNNSSGDLPVAGQATESTVGESAPVRDSTPPPEEAAAAPDALYAVQVAAYETEEETIDILLKLELKGYTGRVVPPDETNRFYRVWVGDTDSHPEARLLQERLKLDDFPTFLKKIPQRR